MNVAAYPNPQHVGYYVNISCEVFDNIGVNIVKVNISYPDGSMVNVTMSGGSYYYNATYTMLGTYHYFIWAEDVSGNSNSSFLHQFEIVENVPPIADFKYSPLHPTTNDIIQFTDLSTDADGSVVNWTWTFGDGETSTEQNPEHKYADDGTYNVTLTVEDDGGASDTVTKIIKVRKPASPHPPSSPIPPETVLIFDGPHEWNITHWEITKETKILFEVHTHGCGLKETKYKIDDGNWTIFTDPFTINKEGMHELFYYSVDECNAYEPVNAAWIEVVNNIAPTTDYVLTPSSPDGDNGWYVSNVTITFTAKDDITGVDSTYYKVDNNGWMKYSDSITITNNGKHIIKYYSIDRAGNKEEAKSITFKIDKTNPMVNFEKPTYGHLYILGKEIMPLKHTVIIGKAMIKINAHDEISGMEKVEFYVDGELKKVVDNEPYEWILDEKIIGTCVIKVIAYDNAGNTASDEQCVWIFNV